MMVPVRNMYRRNLKIIWITIMVSWDAAKSVIRGRLIAFTSHKKKERGKKLSELQENLKVLEREHVERKELMDY